MNKPSSSKISETNWDRIDMMSDEDIDLSDIPEVTDAQMARAILRVNGVPMVCSKKAQPITESQGQK